MGNGRACTAWLFIWTLWTALCACAGEGVTSFEELSWVRNTSCVVDGDTSSGVRWTVEFEGRLLIEEGVLSVPDGPPLSWVTMYWTTPDGIQARRIVGGCPPDPIAEGRGTTQELELRSGAKVASRFFLDDGGTLNARLVFARSTHTLRLKLGSAPPLEPPARAARSDGDDLAWVEGTYSGTVGTRRFERDVSIQSSATCVRGLLIQRLQPRQTGIEKIDTHWSISILYANNGVALMEEHSPEGFHMTWHGCCVEGDLSLGFALDGAALMTRRFRNAGSELHFENRISGKHDGVVSRGALMRTR